MRVDKTLSELWSISDHEDKDVGEVAKMAITAIQKLQEELNQAKKYAENVMNKQSYKVLREKRTSERYERALREIEHHTRATGKPIPHIVKTLKETLPEHRND